MIRRGLLWDISLAYFARYGEWPESLRLVLKGADVPKALADEGRMARAIFLKGQGPYVYEDQDREQAVA